MLFTFEYDFSFVDDFKPLLRLSALDRIKPISEKAQAVTMTGSEWGCSTDPRVRHPNLASGSLLEVFLNFTISQLTV